MTSSVTGVDRGVLKRSDDAILKSAVDADMPVAGVVAMVTDRNVNIYEGAVVLVSHDDGAVEALNPERILLLPDGVEDLWGPDYADLVSLA